MDSAGGLPNDDNFQIVEYPFALRGGKPKRVCVPKSAKLEAGLITMARSWEYLTLAQTYAQAARGGSFVEVGANLGSDTVIAADFFKTVYAFEPAAANRRLLQKTIELNGLVNVQILPAAVSDKPGRAKFYLKEGDNTAVHSLHPNDPDMKPAEDVDVVTLDTAFDNSVRDVTYLHIDTEGHDIKVLQGGRQFIARQANRPVIRMEFQPRTLAAHGSDVSEIIAFIQEFQYRPFYMAGNFMVPLSETILTEMFRLWRGTQGWIDVFLAAL